MDGIGAPAIGESCPDMDYSDIKKNRSNVRYDDNTELAYAYAGNFVIKFNDTTTIKKKVQYAKEHGFGGCFFWALGMDREYELPKVGKGIIFPN